MSAWAVIVAAGEGRRFADPAGVPKTLHPVGDVPMYLRSLTSFDRHAGVDGCVLVFPPIWEGQILEQLVGQVQGPVRLATGEGTRAGSVRAGLDELDDDADIVLIHDAARPLVSDDVISAVIDALESNDAVVPAVPATDTLKRAVDGSVTESIDRDGVWRLQTPQGFRRDVLARAHAGAGEATDDATLVQQLGVTVAIVPGDERTMKVTTMADLAIVERLVEGGGR